MSAKSAGENIGGADGREKIARALREHRGGEKRKTAARENLRAHGCGGAETVGAGKRAAGAGSAFETRLGAAEGCPRKPARKLKRKPNLTAADAAEKTNHEIFR